MYFRVYLVAYGYVDTRLSLMYRLPSKLTANTHTHSLSAKYSTIFNILRTGYTSLMQLGIQSKLDLTTHALTDRLQWSFFFLVDIKTILCVRHDD